MNQAIADARKAADYMNATAPGSPAARQATQAYMETMRLASIANTAHNTNIARQAYQTSQFSVNRVNNVATGRLPNTYMPYDSSGNATSYYNSSRQAGKTPSPDAPRVEDVLMTSTYCANKNTDIDVYIMFSNNARTNSDFTDAANYQMLKALKEGKNVRLIAVNTRAEFEAAWAYLPENAAEVYMMFHSNGKSLIFEENTGTEAYSVDGRDRNGKDVLGNLSTLSPKDIETLYIYACNSGNTRKAKYGDGIAEVMSKVTAGSVIGVDGSLSYGAPDSLVDDEHNIYFPRSSFEQSGTGLFHIPKGLVEYNNGEYVGVVEDNIVSPYYAFIEWTKRKMEGRPYG